VGTKQRMPPTLVVIYEYLRVRALQFPHLAYLILWSYRSLRMRAVLTGLLSLKSADCHVALTLGTSKLCLSLLQ